MRTGIVGRENVNDGALQTARKMSDHVQKINRVLLVAFDSPGRCVRADWLLGLRCRVHRLDGHYGPGISHAWQGQDADCARHDSNGDSLHATDLQLKFSPPDTNSIALEVRYRLIASRDVCVDM